jgi:hypothetical protein
MREHKINSLDNFICGYYLEDKNICDKIINWFDTSGKTMVGMAGGGFNKHIKDSTDASLFDAPQELLFEYLESIQLGLNQYCKKYPYSANVAEWGVTQNSCNIQKYNPAGGYFEWHCERSRGYPPYSNRHLVFMTYLNNVTDAGETEFMHQKIKVKPEKGLTLIWPTDWTHVHRGITSPSQTKYIATGWYSYLKIQPAVGNGINTMFNKQTKQYGTAL